MAIKIGSFEIHLFHHKIQTNLKIVRNLWWEKYFLKSGCMLISYEYRLNICSRKFYEGMYVILKSVLSKTSLNYR